MTAAAHHREGKKNRPSKEGGNKANRFLPHITSISGGKKKKRGEVYKLGTGGHETFIPAKKKKRTGIKGKNRVSRDTYLSLGEEKKGRRIRFSRHGRRIFDKKTRKEWRGSLARRREKV